ncbi:MAG: alpha/beta hydrolase [Phycisphaerales bacterium]|nr:alpha/beta hydrolase [Phycisphaerales bacterium]
MPSTKIEFSGSLGVKLAAILDEPETQTRAYAMFAHCFTCSKDVLAASRISRALAKLGIGTFRFDFTGLGHSEGEFSDTTFSSNIGDLIAGAQWMRENRKAPCILIGHSLGGAAVLAAASSIPECTAIATIGAPSDPEHVTHLFDSASTEIEREGKAEVSIGGRSLTVGKDLVEDLRDHDPQSQIASLNRALLVFHSPVDQIVGIENAAQIYSWAKHPKSFVSLDNADHMLTKPKDADFVANMLSTWADRYAVS